MLWPVFMIPLSPWIVFPLISVNKMWHATPLKSQDSHLLLKSPHAQNKTPYLQFITFDWRLESISFSSEGLGCRNENSFVMRWTLTFWYSVPYHTWGNSAFCCCLLLLWASQSSVSTSSPNPAEPLPCFTLLHRN